MNLRATYYISRLLWWMNERYTRIVYNTFIPLGVCRVVLDVFHPLVACTARCYCQDLSKDLVCTYFHLQTVCVWIFRIFKVWELEPPPPLPQEGHFTHETESPRPLYFKHSHWWNWQSRSKFASHYPWGTNGVCECKMDVKSAWTPYMAFINGSCVMVTWTTFNNHLLE